MKMDPEKLTSSHVIEVNTTNKEKFINIHGRKFHAIVVNPKSNSLLKNSKVIKTTPVEPLNTSQVKDTTSKYSIDKPSYQLLNYACVNPPQMAYRKNQLVDPQRNAIHSSIVQVPEPERRRLYSRILAIKSNKRKIVFPDAKGMEKSDNSMYNSVGTLTDDIIYKVEAPEQVSKEFRDVECQTDAKSESSESLESILDFTDLLPTLDLSPFDSTMINPNKDDFVKMTPKEKLANDLQRALTPDHMGNLPIHNSIHSNDYNVVRRHCLIVKARQHSINLRNEADYTPLQLAVLKNCDVEVIKVLLQHGADVGDIDQNGSTVLHLAVECPNKDILEVLLKHAKQIKFNINAYDFEGLTPLLLSASKSYFESAISLLKFGADKNARDQKSGRTALFYAAENHNERMVELLLFHDADTKLKNFFGTSPHDAMYELTDVPKKIKNLILRKSEKKKREDDLKMKKLALLEPQPVRKKRKTCPILRPDF